MIFVSSVVSALVMWFFIWLLMRKDGVVSLRPVLVISLLICGLTYFVLRFFGSWGLAISFAVLVWSLVQWCFLSWPRALLVAVVWLLVQVGFGWFVSPIF